jgi:restriction endonuclease
MHEGSHSAVWEVIPTFQHLYNGLLKAQADAKNEEDSQYKIGLNNLGVEKMNTYWEKLIQRYELQYVDSRETFYK